jgi:hypothetical protein
LKQSGLSVFPGFITLKGLKGNRLSPQKFLLNRIIFWWPRQEKALVTVGWIRLNHIYRRVDRLDALLGEIRLQVGLLIL